MNVSYVIVTHNRRSSLTRTLKRLRALVPPNQTQDIWVIDNASDDGTVATLNESFPEVHLIERRDNAGACARTDAIGRAAGDLLIFLDDDSYPLPGVTEAAIERFARQPSLGLLAGAIELPDGSAEASAYPLCPVGCGMIGRHHALKELGGFDRWFGRQAEEFDLTLRMLLAGWGVERDPNLVFRHDKPAGQRPAAEVCLLDLRNNLVIADRYLPPDLALAYRTDWTQRYTLIAAGLDLDVSMDTAVAEADEKRTAEARTARTALSPAAVERVFGIEAQARRVAEWSRRYEPRHVLIADFSKNLYATYDACRRSGLEVIAIAENNPAFSGHFYRDVPILDDRSAFELEHDGVIVSTINPAQLPARLRDIRPITSKPILDFAEQEDSAAEDWQPSRGAA
ncbi:MAG: glycosyltransferase [Phycisphaeraceae bacterium]